MIFYGIVGLDRERDWENHHDVRIALQLVRERIAEARRYEDPVVFEIWLSSMPDEQKHFPMPPAD